MEVALPILLTVVSSLIVIFGIVFGIAIVILRRMASRNMAAALANFPQAQVLARSALFFGQQSKGVTQLRGNGTLLLTDDTLYFRKWVPMTEYTIPLGSIRSIETPIAHLGKSYGKPLLKVNYRSEGGSEDAIAWYVRDLESAMAQIEAKRGSIAV